MGRIGAGDGNLREMLDLVLEDVLAVIDTIVRYRAIAGIIFSSGNRIDGQAAWQSRTILV